MVHPSTEASHFSSHPPQRTVRIPFPPDEAEARELLHAAAQVVHVVQELHAVQGLDAVRVRELLHAAQSEELREQCVDLRVLFVGEAMYAEPRRQLVEHNADEHCLHVALGAVVPLNLVLLELARV